MSKLGQTYNARSAHLAANRPIEEMLEELTVHNYDDRIQERGEERALDDIILVDFTERRLTSAETYLDALKIFACTTPMQQYLEQHVIPIVADWPGQLYIQKAIVQESLKRQPVAPIVKSFIPMMGPLHVSLNSRELVGVMFTDVFERMYRAVYGTQKKLGKKPNPWKLSLILEIARSS
jgi:hypothetical protein